MSQEITRLKKLLTMAKEQTLIAVAPDKLNEQVKELCWEYFVTGIRNPNLGWNSRGHADIEVATGKQTREEFERIFGETKII